jgi:hypothetical protein
MKRILWFMIVFMNTGFVTIFTACNNNSNLPQNQYYYYPKANVYYDVQRSLYFYSLNGGQSWDSVARLSDKEPSTLGNRETVYSTSLQVYKENEAHRKKYGGSLFLLANEGSASEADSGATERSVTGKGYHHKTTAKRSSGNEKPAKKPLKDFFKKIFGKRKDR